MYYFIAVYSGLNVARLFWLLLVSKFFLVILETPLHLLILPKTHRLLDVLRLLTKSAKMSIYLENPLVPQKEYCTNL
jgi:hypothetical protein